MNGRTRMMVYIVQAWLGTVAVAAVTILGLHGTVDAAAAVGILGAVVGLAGGVAGAEAGGHAAASGSAAYRNGVGGQPDK